jgi:hydroxymethylglutaryl-CoA lyase
MQFSNEVNVVEVGPRDGLQNEDKQVSTEDKVRFIEAIAAAGMPRIEITSFVSPKWIPQLADGLEVATRLHLPPATKTLALVPNMKGYESAKKANLPEVAFFLSATESHSKKNINKSVADAIENLKEVASAAKSDGRRIRCYVSVVFVCPYEGKVAPSAVANVVSHLLEIGVDEISLGDTIGAAVPTDVTAMVKLLSRDISVDKLALHFHDTRGTALANVLAGLEAGVKTFDASLGGLGGCPYAPGAAGNLATEDLLYMLHGMGIKTGVDLDKLIDASAFIQGVLGKKLPGRYLQAALATRAKAQAAGAILAQEIASV